MSRTRTAVLALAPLALILSACGGDNGAEDAARTFVAGWNGNDEQKDCVTMTTGNSGDKYTAADVDQCLEDSGDLTPDDNLEVFETEELGDGLGVILGTTGDGAFGVYLVEEDDKWTPREYVVLTDGERANGEGIPRLEGEVSSS